MNTETNMYTVSVYTENNIGLLNRISAIFQRRHFNIESLNTSVSEIEGGFTLYYCCEYDGGANKKNNWSD